uniref:Uncharacterized protein n=1 Tax=Sinocyclocheilus rhinocerous TaxID=307959 RepID=A0A673NAU0_9TELE
MVCYDKTIFENLESEGAKKSNTGFSVLQDLFGLKISSRLLAHPEVSEGSADEAPPPSRVFLDLLGRHRKLQGRSRKGVARGCFGMKVDRIGVISGLGC